MLSSLFLSSRQAVASSSKFASRSAFSTSTCLRSGINRRRNSFNLTVDASKTANASRQKSSSVPPTSIKAKALPTVSTSLFEQTSAPKNMQAKELALDMFFSGHRPLFMMDHFGPEAKADAGINTKPAPDTREYMPWDVSVSGLPLNSEMKNVPRSIVRNLVPFSAPPTEDEALSLESSRLRKRLENENAYGLNGGSGVEVFSMEVNGSDNQGTSGMFNHDSNKNGVTEFSIIVDEELAHSPEVARSLARIKNMFLNDVDVDKLPQIVYSPTSLSFGRFIHATSVKRKRKLKMNKHKLRKRRKLQRSTRRKLKR